MAGQQQQQRVAIDKLNRENLRLQGRLLAVQRRQHAAAAADGPWLEGQVKLYKLKAHQEEQLAEQIQRELETIRQQVGFEGSCSAARQVLNTSLCVAVCSCSCKLRQAVHSNKAVSAAAAAASPSSR